MNNYFESGKIPPQAVDMEEAVLGALMLEQDAIYEICDFLKPDSFYKEAHQIIYKAAIELNTKSNPIDILTITEQLRLSGKLDQIGGPFYIIQLTNSIASASNIEFHSRIIYQKFIQRELIRVSSAIQNMAFDESIELEDLIDYSENELYQVTDFNIKKDAVILKEAIRDKIKEIEIIQKQKNKLTGIPSGITRVDRIISGWQKTDLIIIAARPSMGKTAYALNCAKNSNVPTALFSLEMSTNQLTGRLMCIDSEYTPTNLRDGNIEWEILDNHLNKIVDLPIYLDDTAALSLMELRAKARRLKMKYDIQLIIIDYIQLMTNSNEQNKKSREQEISSISRGLKVLAKELDIPIIALSQMNRGVENRSSKRPQLSDLRESGAIEQDADIVMFLHRPEKYGIFQDDEGNSLVNIVEIIISKHRNGMLDDIIVKVNDNSLTKWDVEDIVIFDNYLEVNKEFENDMF